LLTTQNWFYGNVLEESEKLDSSRKYTRIPYGEKIVKIGPVDTEIALLIVKKKKKRRN